MTFDENPSKGVHWKRKILYLQLLGHDIVYKIDYRKYVFLRYDEFTFKNNEEDQALAREMINLDYDTLMIKFGEEAAKEKGDQ